MKCKNKTIVNSEDYNMDDKTKSNLVNQDAIRFESQKHHLPLNDTHFVKCNVDTKVGIKQETWDPNVLSDIKSEAPSLDLVPFLDPKTIKDGDVVDIKKECFNQDEIKIESHKFHLLQNGTCTKSELDIKTGIKQETGDPNEVSRDIKSETPSLDLVPFLGPKTMKDVVDIKKECFNQDEILIESQKVHLLQNATYLQREMDTKTGIKQETCDSNLLSRDIKYETPSLDLVPFLGSSKIKSNDEIIIKEEPWECCETLAVSQNEEKESNAKKNVAPKQILPLESSRLPTKSIKLNGKFVTFLLVEKGGTLYKTACIMNTSLEKPMSQDILSQTRERGSEKNIHKHLSVYKCEDCEKTYTAKGSLKRHALLHSPNKLYKCDICQESFGQKPRLESHIIKVHLATKPYKCDTCEKTFADRSNLIRHKLTHSGLKPYKCDICGKCFTKKSSLQGHTTLHSDTTPYKCEVCEKTYTVKGSLKRHALLHSPNKRYKCDICQESFGRKPRLESHIISVHLATKPYKCDTCEKTFADRSYLIKHKQTHSGLKPHKCDICGKCFTQKSSLQGHTMLHSDATPYKCDICGKYFRNNTCLRRHSNVHLGTKPFKCDICNKCFKWKPSLNTHLVAHSRNTSHKYE